VRVLTMMSLASVVNNLADCTSQCVNRCG